ncbi:1871_t:CDS:2 [Dentiscutata heterogama]|uniref:1871_t:CDS:1 n=1 Tax=Dentiscutata heterogama TaxID=1316150 RepID=A0ACA9K1B5_9GLOM|nr:1871_t:CDS:2 [Dentiscutata heterogama]
MQVYVIGMAQDKLFIFWKLRPVSLKSYTQFFVEDAVRSSNKYNFRVIQYRLFKYLIIIQHNDRQMLKSLSAVKPLKKKIQREK